MIAGQRADRRGGRLLARAIAGDRGLVVLADEVYCLPTRSALGWEGPACSRLGSARRAVCQTWATLSAGFPVIAPSDGLAASDWSQARRSGRPRG